MIRFCQKFHGSNPMLKLVEKFGFIKEENDMKKYLN